MLPCTLKSRQAGNERVWWIQTPVHGAGTPDSSIRGRASGSAGDTFLNSENSMQSVLWITWERHTRTRNIASRIGVRLEEIVTSRTGLRRYLSSGLRTAACLHSCRPKVLLVQNPSMILTGLVLLLRPVLRYRLVVDAHNEAVEPYQHNDRFGLWLARQYMKRADLTIVTNEMMATVVNACGGRATILPDRIPDCTATDDAERGGKPRIVMIATFAADEPVEEFLQAAGEFEDRLVAYVTGRAEKLSADARALVKSNVHFTGYLEEQDYWKLLATADGIVDLTKKDNCLVCGAYEGVAAGKPLILSDNAATRAHFSKGVLYVDNSASGISKAIGQLLEQQVELQAQIVALRDELRTRWISDADRLVAVITTLSRSVDRSTDMS
jgi:glycosyltransferase involved in cell wall biosynthesis